MWEFRDGDDGLVAIDGYWGDACFRMRGIGAVGNAVAGFFSDSSTSFSIGVFSTSLSLSSPDFLTAVLTVTTLREPSEPPTLTRETTGAAAPVTGVHLSELGAENVRCWLEIAPPLLPLEKRVFPIVDTGCILGVPMGVAIGEAVLFRNPTR